MSENSNFEGVFNACAPNPVSNFEITKKIAQTLNKPFFMPNVPSFALKLIFGEMAAVILMSQNVSNEKIIQTGFKFRYENVSEALKNLLN
jgi:NAD dependent epimerase/dehydratase family enzyme